jgi:hypothetical protein
MIPLDISSIRLDHLPNMAQDTMHNRSPNKYCLDMDRLVSQY